MLLSRLYFQLIVTEIVRSIEGLLEFGRNWRKTSGLCTRAVKFFASRSHYGIIIICTKIMPGNRLKEAAFSNDHVLETWVTEDFIFAILLFRQEMMKTEERIGN